MQPFLFILCFPF